MAEHIALTGHTIDWNATERLASYGKNTRKRKIMEAVDILFQTKLMNMRLDERRVSDNFGYCLEQTWRFNEDIKKKTIGPKTTIQQQEETSAKSGS
ncbi:unnamed protein product [Protopolystoma xenopodis]|uniref:Uncharacterized protein n=1 Tax=Protopolystoma xenopodis TaxID=117903 RepID=A0A448X0F7_9PLAT|nr:unnamed protein product [Protopolystoma xenopodis]